MPDLLYYSRSRCTSVEQLDARTVRSSCHLEDTLTEGIVEIVVRVPDLEITDAKARIRRRDLEESLERYEPICKVIGIRVGAGMLKMIKGLLGEEGGCAQLAFMVEECCQGVILSFTKDVLKDVPKEETKKREYYRNMVKENVRLYNRCAAFAPGSPLVEGIEPPR